MINLESIGFVKVPHWNHKVKANRVREVYVKGDIKAFCLHNGVSLGLLINKSSPACSKHKFTTDKQGIEQTIKLWTQTQ